MNDCEQYRDLISRLVDGELSGDEKIQLTEHLRSCEDCAALYEIFSALSRTIGEDLEEPPEELCVNVMAKLRRDKIWKKNYVPLKKILTAAACVAVILLAAGGILPKVLDRSASTAITDVDSGDADKSGYLGEYGAAAESEDSPLVRSDSAEAGTGKASKEVTAPVTSPNGSITSQYPTTSEESKTAPKSTVAPTVRPIATANPTVAPTVQPIATANPTVAPTVRPIATANPTVAPTVQPTAAAIPTVAPTARPAATVAPTVAPVQSSTVATTPTAPAVFESEAAGEPIAEPTAPAATDKTDETAEPVAAATAVPSNAKAAAAPQKSSDADGKASDQEQKKLNTEAPSIVISSDKPASEDEAAPKLFTVSLVGSCQLAAPEKLKTDKNGLPLTIGKDMSYPFANTADFFAHDELTLAALECSLNDAGTAANAAPEAYGEIFSRGGVDFVSTIEKLTATDKESSATNDALENAGVIPGEQGQSQIVTTANNLKIGVYTAGQTDTAAAAAAIEQLKKDGAEYIICMLRWSDGEGYSPSDSQSALAHDCIAAGADLVFGSGSQHLLPVEDFEGALIVYDLGNWISASNTAPTDPDTAIIRLNISRDGDGTVSMESYELIPCCQSSDLDGAADAKANFNDYCPSPYEEDSDEYQRTLSKMEGKYEAPAETSKP